MKKHLLLTAVLIPALALAGCTGASEEGQGNETDPATDQALNDQIMVNPDLANQNEGNAALTGGTDQSLPPENMTPAAIQDAQNKAFALLGGTEGMTKLPAPKQYGDAVPETAALTAAAKAALSPGAGNCADKVEYSAAWAAKLPSIFPVYPRGTAKEAAGTDAGACSLRVVSFLTPVPLQDVMSFYHSRAITGGYTSEYALSAGDNIVSGTKGEASYVVYGRRLKNGITEVELITSGNK
ncbi:hypothetical protein GCM10023115_21750 [Pontixanthobacter gangjinensis]|uniref:Lipoprotein n=1 Tax=Pontixanthobacter gangjinensis TaxID=1028742 RepID=A0A6I4SNC7_9SPHN|nr:hypothetical protein [Pontixanthobacter gangjinensis]MXO57421.1 hypothetical protein [Pontixanthobacter gangjinensis]